MGETLVFGIHGALVQRAAALVVVVLAANVARHLPRNRELVASGQRVVQYAARVQHRELIGEEALIQAHVVNEDGDDSFRALLKFRRNGKGLVVVHVRCVTSPGAKELRVEPHGMTKRRATLGLEEQLGLRSIGGKVAAVDQRTDMIAVVAGVERRRCCEFASLVVGHLLLACRPACVVVLRLDFRKQVNVGPIALRQVWQRVAMVLPASLLLDVSKSF